MTSNDDVDADDDVDDDDDDDESSSYTYMRVFISIVARWYSLPQVLISITWAS